MPRFVILEHDHPSLHWDLLLEAGEMLRAWRLAAPPAVNQVVAATANTDHRLLYLDYEGPVSGNRGTVKRWDAGSFTGTLDGDRIDLMMNGARVRGSVVLSHLQDLDWRLEYQ